ncbi:MAG: RagB/SusD family nutrient uptake outer membrane protein, partial [Odoribacteraceae bacterium]|nr:RagB/SusD family nutrient uptake outer membrane protein [Odoribacteraceae bacterium]
MKRNTIITAIALLVTQAIATSCNEWLEVDSSANVQEELLFSDPEGYRTAVNGVYRLLSAPELYGQQLTWGAASVLGNNYDDTRLPGGQYYDVSYRELAAGDYESQYSLAWIDPIWMQGYRVIANCNNIIAYIEAESPDFFTRRDDERDMILGEMLGLRAMMHLDILRLFAPSAKADDGKPYIPYVTVF